MGWLCVAAFGVFILNFAQACGRQAHWEFEPPKQYVKEGELIDINRASPKDLRRLPGIGPVFADRIVQNRPYRNLGDLQRVPGMKDGRIRKIKPYITGFIAPTPTPWQSPTPYYRPTPIPTPTPNPTPPQPTPEPWAMPKPPQPVWPYPEFTPPQIPNPTPKQKNP